VADERGRGRHGGGPTKAWLWVLGGVIAALAVVVVVLLLTRDNGSDTTTAATSTLVTTSTTAAPTTEPTTTTISVTTTTVALPVITNDPQTYAEYLFAAWQNNDRTAAANVASADAVNQMFSRPYPAQGPYTLFNCGPAAGSLYCTWNGTNGATIQMTVRTLTGGLPIQVQMVTFSP
jgi:hypothetical protein